VTTADRKRLAVLRNIHNVHHGWQHEEGAEAKNVHGETAWLLYHGLIEVGTDSSGDHRYRITDAGRDQLDEWEVAA
jgi:hypothetical protein